MRLRNPFLVTIACSSTLTRAAAAAGIDAKSPVELLDFSAGFLVKFGFIGVALLLLAMAWFTRAGNAIFARTVATFGVAFLVVYGVLNLSIVFFPGSIVKSNSFLVGELDGVRTQVGIRMRSGDQIVRPPFERVENDPYDDGFQSHLFLFSFDHPFSCFTVFLTYPRTADRNEKQFSFNVGLLDMVRTTPTDKLVLSMTGDGEASRLGLKWVDMTGQASAETVIEPLEHSTPPGRVCGRDKRTEAVRSGRPSLFGQSGWWFEGLIGSALAQPSGAPDGTRFEKALKSEDNIIRRGAREDLADYGAKAAPLIKEFLDSNEYRLKLGATEAIRRMSPPDRASVAAAVGPELQSLQHDADKTLAESAQGASATAN